MLTALRPSSSLLAVIFCALVVLFSLAACGLGAGNPVIQVVITATPAPSNPPAPTVVASSTPSPWPATATRLPATATATRTPGISPTFAPTPTVSPALAIATVRPRPTDTATPFYPPGIYVTHARTDPPAPVRGEPVTFYVTFLNTTETPVQYDWLVQIYGAETNKGFGETAVQRTSISPGENEYASANNWKVSGGGGCLEFYARVQNRNSDMERVPFLLPAGEILSLPFQVCPS